MVYVTQTQSTQTTDQADVLARYMQAVIGNTDDRYDAIAAVADYDNEWEIVYEVLDVMHEMEFAQDRDEDGRYDIAHDIALAAQADCRSRVALRRGADR